MMVSPATFRQRQEQLRADMESAGVDLVIAYADVWRPGNVFYLTNWRQPAGGISQAWCLLLLPLNGPSTLLVGFETTLQGPEIAVVDQVERSDQITELLAALNRSLRPQRIGLIGIDLLPLQTYRQIAGAFDAAEVIDARALLTRQRRIKSAAEIDLMRQAAALSDGAMEAAIAAMHSGATESEIAAAGNCHIMQHGAVLSFYPTVVTGSNSARAMQMATDRKVRRGDLVLLDFGACLDGYYGDISRTVSYGRLNRTEQAVLETAIAASAAGLAAVQPGVEMKQVELAVRQIIIDAGFGKYLLHNVGHGIGTDQEEDFPIGPDSDVVLEVGMTFTVEPGIYKPGTGGCRIEDVVVVTENGGEALGKVRRDLFIEG